MSNRIVIRGDKITIIKPTGQQALVSKQLTFDELENEKEHDTTPSGFMNYRIKSKIEKIVYNWLDSLREVNKSLPFKERKHPTFITLTLPAKQAHPDKILTRHALGKFLIYMQRLNVMNNYIWRAERQKNGNIHYHIICDDFIPYQLVKLNWNNIMNQLGYIAQYKLNQLYKIQNLPNINNYRQEYEMNSEVEKLELTAVFATMPPPNSTDIHKLKSIKNPAAYVTKYMSKSDYYLDLKKQKTDLDNGMIDEATFKIHQKRLIDLYTAEKIDGRIWGSSDSVKDLRDLTLPEFSEVKDFLSIVIDTGEVKIFQNDYVTVLYVKNLQSHITEHRYLSDAFSQNSWYNYNTIQQSIKAHDYANFE